MLTRCNHTALNYNIRPLLRSSLIVGLISLSLFTSGCLYRIDVQQGNIVSADALAKLKQGMTPEQVRYILGTPLLVDVFHEQRWDYYYSLKPGQGELEEKKVQLYFDNERLSRIAADKSIEVPKLSPLERPNAPSRPPLL